MEINNTRFPVFPAQIRRLSAKRGNFTDTIWIKIHKPGHANVYHPMTEAAARLLKLELELAIMIGKPVEDEQIVALEAKIAAAKKCVDTES